ncbi:Ecm29 protein [Martiniozyma asiatica (nom. inval.)]|nr:Ecm29 protein [Martiniozyma asiatica]
MNNELQLIQKVELRLALAKTDDAFQTQFNTYLTPLLLKFASTDPLVKQALIKTIKFLLSKFNTIPNLKVPYIELLDQIKNPNLKQGQDSTLVQTYSLLFLGKGIDRQTQNEKSQLFSLIWSGISNYKLSVAARIFNISCKLIVSMDELPSFPVLDLNDDKFVFDCLYKLMLLHPTKLGENGQILSGITQQGLASKDVDFLTYLAGVSFTSSTLSQYKLKLLKLIELANSDNKTLVVLCATADGDSVISSFATTCLKRILINYENEQFINKLIDLFVGNGQPPVKSQLQEKILNVLCKSKIATKSVYLSQLTTLGLDSSNNRVKHLTISFIRWFTTISAASDDVHDSNNQLNDESAAVIANKLKLNLSTIDNNPSNFKIYSTQRQMQYETLGYLLKKCPNLLSLSYISFLFDMLKVEEPEIRSTVSIALSGLGSELNGIDDNNKEKLKLMLKNIIYDSSLNKENFTSGKYVAIKLINSIFPFDDSECRFLNIIAQSGSENGATAKLEIVEEAKKGLHPYWFQVSNSYLNTESAHKFPKFNDIISVIKQNRSILDSNSSKAAINFSWQCLVMNSIEFNLKAKSIIPLDQDWEVRLNKAVEFDSTVHNCLINELKRIGENNSDNSGDRILNETSTIVEFIELSFEQAFQNDSLSILKTVYKILSLSDNSNVELIVNEKYILGLLNALDTTHLTEVTYYICSTLGVLVSHPLMPDEKINEIIEKRLQLSTPGSILALGHIISRLSVRNHQGNFIFENYIGKLLTLVNAGIVSSSSMMIKCSLKCIGELSLFKCLSNLTIPDVEILNQIKIKVSNLVKKHDELATMTWAFLSLSFLENPSSTNLNDFESLIYDTHSTKHTDFLFTTGECWSILSSGWNSKVLRNYNDILSSETPETACSRLSIILDVIIKSCLSTKPALSKAGCIWLLSVVQYCSGNSINLKMKEIQYCFMRSLTSKEEIVQEASSRGLSIIYESGNTEMQDILIHDLLVSFTDSNKTTKDLISGYVDKETQLFENGSLPTGNSSNTEFGSSVNTYKDVLNLASEIGDPSLVYKFMSLAKNSALWSSRKGIAFGLGAILDKSKLDQMLKNNSKLSQRLIPKLFRYKHDPNNSVSRTMNEIWNSLILDNKKTINNNFDSIFKECLSGMGSREWRVREASTMALLDLLNQSDFEIYESNLENIWQMSFRAMDDIKASVRKEGEKLTRFLANTMITKIKVKSDSSNETGQNNILKQLIPFLLGSNGLLNDVEEVKNFAFETISKLVNTNSKLLKPFVTEMVEQMILMMSSVEPQVVNYIALNADKYKLKQEDIDGQRMGMVGSSPLMEAIEKLLNLLDDNNMKEFVEHLASAVKNAVGLPSKVAASKVIVDLMVKHYFVAKEYGDKLLKISSGQLKDRNETVAKSYAIACGYAVRSASTKQVSSLAKKLNRYYFEKREDERLPKIASITCEAVFSNSNDKFQSIASGFLPLAFIGKHDLIEEISKPFGRVWLDAASSSLSAIKLYFTEIVTLMKQNIETSNFSLRHTIALSITEIVTKLELKINEINSQEITELLEIVLEALKGRTYDGKEKLLDSLVLLSKNLSEFFETNDELFALVQNRVISEANRQNIGYKKHSVLSLGNFLGAYPENEAFYDTYIKLMNELLEDGTEEEDIDGDINMDGKLTTSDQIIYTQRLLNNIISSLSNDKPHYQTLLFLLDKTLSYLKTDINYIKTNDGKHKFKLGAINILRREILFVYGDQGLGVVGADINFKIFKIWEEIGKIVALADELQSVVVPFVRVTKNLIDTKMLSDEEIQKCQNILQQLKSYGNTVVSMEVDGNNV